MVAITELTIVITDSPQISIIFVHKLYIYKNLTDNSIIQEGIAANNFTHVVRKHFKSSNHKQVNNLMTTMNQEFYV